ncbi:MAG: plasmid pRiA4b ORF-3 family protein [Syntrophobacteraceae bacterium]
MKGETGKFVPVCLGGARACPPENVGGVWGYEDFLAAYFDPSHEEHENLHDWAGDDFDPERLDLEAVNERLRKLR